MKDWEKRTFKRAPLSGAAAFPFNDGSTPGQALLSSLQASELARKDRFFNSVEGKLKEATKGQVAAKHAPEPSSTIFGDPTAAVNGLLDAVRTEKPAMTGIRSRLAAREAQHQAAWEAYCAARDAANSELHTWVAERSSGFKSWVAADDASLAEDMAELEDDSRCMKLDEPSLRKVLEKIEAGVPVRAGRIDELSLELDGAEAKRSQFVDTALRRMVEQMAEAAHVSPGEVARTVEREALQLNRSILANRRAYSELMHRLQVSEVQLEKKRREDWQQAMKRWRTLRIQHAMDLFNRMVTSPEFAEPPTRAAIFQDLCRVQHDSFHLLMEQLLRARSVALSVGKAQQWASDASALLQGASEQVLLCMQRLRHDEDAREADVQQALADLLEECRGYQGYPEEELQLLISSQCETTATSRRTAALQLISDASAAMDEQARQWSCVAHAVGDFLAALSGMDAAHQQHWAELERGVRAAMKAMRETFNASDTLREEVFGSAVESISQAHNEKALDDTVAAALARLDDIENGYRSFQQGMVGLAREHPITIKRTHDAYHIKLCGHLLLRPLVEPAEQPDPKQADEQDAAAEGDGIQGPEAAAEAQKEAGEEEDGQAAPEVQEQTEEEEELLEVDGDHAFVLEGDLFSTLIVRPQEPESQASTSADAGPQEAVAAAGEDGPDAAEGGSGAGGEEVGEGDPDEDGGEAAAAPPRPWSCALDFPEPALRESLRNIQVDALLSMVQFERRTVEQARKWAMDREIAFTNELDDRLRAHRPRASSVEEEARAARSAELVGQRRQVNLHLQNQAQAIQDQVESFEEKKQQLEALLQAQLDKLEAYHHHMLSCQGNKSLDIRDREAKALKVRLEKLAAAESERLSDFARSSTAKISAANAAFDAATLKTFEQGGRFAERNIQDYRDKMAHIDAHTEKVREKEEKLVAKLQKTVLEKAEKILGSLATELPIHRHDLQLIEAMDHALDRAQYQVLKVLGQSDEAGQEVDAILEGLSGLLGPERLPASCDGADTHLKHAEALVAQLDVLGKKLLPRAASLRLLATRGLQLKPCDIALLPQSPPDAAPAAPGEQPAAAPAEALNGPIREALDAARAACKEASAAYYSGKEAARKPTRPERIPDSDHELTLQVEQRLEGLAAQLAEHEAAAGKQLHCQVVTAFRLVQGVPSWAIQGLAEHQLQLFDLRMQEVRRQNNTQRQEVEAARKVHKRTLSPALMHPRNAPSLAQLKLHEGERAARAHDLLQSFAASFAAAVQEQAGQLQQVLLHFATTLMTLLDNITLPGDLSALEGAEAALNELGSMNLKRLQILDEAQAESGGEAADGSAGGDAGAKGGKGGKAGKGGAEADAATRPFPLRKWPVPAGQTSLEELGWDKETMQTCGVEVATEEEPEAPPDPKDKKPAADKGAKKGGADVADGEPRTPSVLGLDTPMHTAVVRAHAAATRLSEQRLRALVVQLRQDCTQMRVEEERWSASWQNLLSNADRC